MDSKFQEALRIAKEKYPHQIDHYEEYENYYVFEHLTDEETVGGTESPIVIRKSDMAAFNYESVFFDFSDKAEDVGDVISEGSVD